MRRSSYEGAHLAEDVFVRFCHSSGGVLVTSLANSGCHRRERLLSRTGYVINLEPLAPAAIGFRVKYRAPFPSQKGRCLSNLNHTRTDTKRSSKKVSPKTQARNRGQGFLWVFLGFKAASAREEPLT